MSGIGGVEVPGQQFVQFRLGLWHSGSVDGPPIVEVLKKACVINIEDVAGKAMGIVLVGMLSMLIRSW